MYSSIGVLLHDSSSVLLIPVIDGMPGRQMLCCRQPVVVGEGFLKLGEKQGTVVVGGGFDDGGYNTSFL